MNSAEWSSPEELQKEISASEGILRELNDGIEKLDFAMNIIPGENRIAQGALWDRQWKLRLDREHQTNWLAVLKTRLRRAEGVWMSDNPNRIE